MDHNYKANGLASPSLEHVFIHFLEVLAIYRHAALISYIKIARARDNRIVEMTRLYEEKNGKIGAKFT